MLNKKSYSIFTVCLLILVMFIGLVSFDIDIGIVKNVEAATLTVNDDGGADYTTLQAAIDNASAGDTIYVWEGTYNEDIYINKSLTIIGNSSTNTTIQGTQAGHVVYIDSDYVNLTGFFITKSRWQHRYDGVYLYYSNYCRIEYCNISGNYEGLFLYYSDYCKIENNTAYNTGAYGFSGRESDYCRFENNTIKGWSSMVMYIEYRCTNLIIRNNNISTGYYGIYIYYSSNFRILNNNISDCYYGVYHQQSDYSIYENNTLYDNSCGIYMYYSRGCVFKYTVFIECGLYLAGNGIDRWNTHTIDDTNTVNGKPIYYLYDRSNENVSAVGKGQLILANCHYMNVTDLNFSNGSVGILLGHSDYNLIEQNNCSYQHFRAMALEYSDHNRILNNSCYSNQEAGLYIENSWYNFFQNNTCRYNSQNGIQNRHSRYNTFDHNDCSKNQYGFRIEYSNSMYNIFSNNTCVQNSQRGMYLYYSRYNEILNNNCSDNRYGIYLYYNSDYNIISNNLCDYNTNDGIRVNYRCNDNIVKNNSCTYNSDNGIYVYDDVYNNVFEFNICDFNSDYGIYTRQNSRYNLIENNSCNFNLNYGIHLTSTAYENRIINNYCNFNVYGIILTGSSNNNLVKNNYCNFNNYGIYLDGVFSITLDDNDCNFNNINGITTLNSDHSTIVDNSCISSNNYNILLQNSINITIEKNDLLSTNGMYIGQGGLHRILDNTIKVYTTTGAALTLDQGANNCTIMFNKINTTYDKCDGIDITNCQDLNIEKNTIDTWGNDSYGIDVFLGSRITHKDNNINTYGSDSFGMRFDDCNDDVYNTNIHTYNTGSVGALIDNSIVNFYSSTIMAYNNVSFGLTNDAEVYALNCKFNSGNVLYNIQSNLTVANYLTISVNYSNAQKTPVPNVEVNLTSNGNPVYQSDGYGGKKPKTKADGMVRRIIVVSHDYIQTETPNYKTIRIELMKDIQGRHWDDTRVPIDMKTSHTEYFKPGVDIAKPYPPENPAVESFPDGQALTVSWDDVFDAASYRLFWNESGDVDGSFSNIQDISSNNTSVEGLTDGKQYAFKVKAKDASGLFSDLSLGVAGIPMDTQPPAKPTGFVTTEVTAKFVNLSWNANTEPDLEGYKLYRILGKITDVLGTTTETWFNDTTVKESKNYIYRLSAFDEVPNHSPKAELAAGVVIPILPPKIVYVEPDRGEVSVPIDTWINITFSKSMNTESVMTSFSISPNVEGEFIWLDVDRVLSIKPNDDLDYLTKYTITIKTSAVDKAFNYNLSETEVWSFTTVPDLVPPKIVKHSPSGDDVLISAKIEVKFSELMNPIAVKNAFTISPAHNGTISWEQNKFVFTPEPLLNYNTTYKVTISTAAMDLPGNKIAKAYSWEFTTLLEESSPPEIVDYSPLGTNVSVDTKVTIEFTKPMNKRDTERAFEITPKVSGGRFTWIANELQYSHSDFKTNTTYQVSISTGAKDSTGKSLPLPLSWEFSTSMVGIYRPPRITKIFPEPGSEVEIDTKIAVLFNKAISVPPGKLMVKTQGGDSLNGTSNYNSKDRNFSFDLPEGNYLDYGYTFVVTLSGINIDIGKYGAEEFDITLGNNTYSWTFQTKAEEEADTDGDGMNDEWENDNGLNPLDSGDAKKDPDGDGLTNKKEYNLDTDPSDEDSDDDGLNDGDEVNKYLTDPLDEDSDDDKFTDGAEVEAETDPNDQAVHPPEKKESKDEPFDFLFLLLAIIVIVVVVLVIVFMVLRKKGSGRSKTGPKDSDGDKDLGRDRDPDQRRPQGPESKEDSRDLKDDDDEEGDLGEETDGWEVND